MKKYIISVVMLLAVFSLAVAFSVSTQSVQAQTTSTNSCYTFTRNFGVGTQLTSTEASALQNVLVNEGVWNSINSVTSYDESVASAVVGLQEKYTSDILTPNGLSHGTGYFGISTRTKINSLYGCSSSSQSITVYSGYGSSQGSTFVCPSGYTCRVTNPVITCPTGYICNTSPGTPQNGTCPAGYICNPVVTPTPQPPVYTCPAGFTCRPTNSQNPIAPILNSISPTRATLGEYITVYGSGFSRPSTAVIFYGNGTSQQASPNSVSSEGTTIGIYVPSDLSAGTYRVTVANLGNGLTSESVNGISLSVCPAGYTCSSNTTTLPICPLGYTCTPTPGTLQNGDCPAGYTCSANTTPTTTCPSGYTCITNPGAPQIGNCPAGYTCYIPVSTLTCPTGYTCTPSPGNPQNGDCPAGYTCSANFATVICPLGYTCTFAPGTPQNGDCPAGYTCSAPVTIICPAGFTCSTN